MTLHAPAVFWPIEATSNICAYDSTTTFQHTRTEHMYEYSPGRITRGEGNAIRCSNNIARIDTGELSAPSPVRSLRECTIRSAAAKVLSDQSSPIRLWFSVAGHSSFHASVTHRGEVSEVNGKFTEQATNAPGTGLT